MIGVVWRCDLELNGRARPRCHSAVVQIGRKHASVVGDVIVGGVLKGDVAEELSIGHVERVNDRCIADRGEEKTENEPHMAIHPY
jgi:hypothetical protein